MADFARVTPTGWRIVSDTTASARVTPTGWNVQSAGGVAAPTLLTATFTPGSVTSSAMRARVTFSR